MADHSSGRDSEESDRSLKSNMIPEHQFLLDEASEQNFGKRASPFLWAWRFTITILAQSWVAPLVTHSHHQGDVFDSSNPWPKPRLSPLPDDVFQTVKKTFYPEESYIGPSNETHRNWDELVAAHDALYIAEPETYGLPEGIPPPFDHPNKINDGPHNFYVIAGLHQMHCLVSENCVSRRKYTRCIANTLAQRTSLGSTISKLKPGFLNIDIIAKKPGKLIWSIASNTCVLAYPVVLPSPSRARHHSLTPGATVSSLPP